MRINTGKGVQCAAQSGACGTAHAQQLALVLQRKLLWLSVTDKMPCLLGLSRGPRDQAGTQGQRDPGSSSVASLSLGFLGELVGYGIRKWLPFK